VRAHFWLKLIAFIRFCKGTVSKKIFELSLRFKWDTN
jgi:hypothetical protein